MTSRAGYFEAQQTPDLERRLASVLRYGVVKELDEAKARVRVQAGKVVTGWIPWAALRAGPDSHWSPPEVGEQVIVAAPSGDLAQGVVVGSIYRDKHPAPGNKRTVSIQTWADGAAESYDRENHAYNLYLPEGGTVTVTVGGTSWILNDGGATLVTPMTRIIGKVEIDGDLKVKGKLSAAGDIMGGAVSLQHHVHEGVSTGTDLSGEPPNGGEGGTPDAPFIPASSQDTIAYFLRDEPDGSKVVLFPNGSTIRADRYGNQIMGETHLSGPLNYVQAHELGEPGQGWKPVGDKVYTDTAGNVLPSVTYQPAATTSTPAGPVLVPPVTITQTVPVGDPLPGNQQKFT